MTDHIDHRAAAEGELLNAIGYVHDADLSKADRAYHSVNFALIHALLAIHDTLTAADRYAANEAKQREEAEPDPLALDEAECSRCGTTYPSTDKATLAHHRACTGETPENPMGDPLDEDDHRDRIVCDGGRIVRNGPRHWHTPLFGLANWCDGSYCGRPSLADWDRRFGPLTFAPEPTPDAAGDDLSAPEDESGAEERGEAEEAPEPLLCPECGHGIDEHGWEADYAITCCLACDDPADCRRAPSDIARALIEQAVEQPRSSK